MLSWTQSVSVVGNLVGKVTRTTVQVVKEHGLRMVVLTKRKNGNEVMAVDSLVR